MAKYIATVGQHTYEIVVSDGQEITVDGRRHFLDFKPIVSGVFLVRLNSKNYRLLIESQKSEVVHVRVYGRSYIVHLQNELQRRLGPLNREVPSGHARTEIRAPMPGLVVGVNVQRGDRVQPGSTLIILEAMKMENEIRSLHDGFVAEVRVQEGSAVEKGEVLLTFR